MPAPPKGELFFCSPVEKHRPFLFFLTLKRQKNNERKRYNGPIKGVDHSAFFAGYSAGCADADRRCSAGWLADLPAAHCVRRACGGCGGACSPARSASCKTGCAALGACGCGDDGGRLRKARCTPSVSQHSAAAVCGRSAGRRGAVALWRDTVVCVGVYGRRCVYALYSVLFAARKAYGCW